jgi:DNA polymerase III sliding clamp (beta) subunit (PCNA family)
MLEALQFVKGATSKENKYTPVLNHFHIADGRITGVNEVFGISAPITTDIHATPKGPDFAKAIEKCKGTINLFMENDRLVVKSGRMTVRIDCTTEPFPMVQPEGKSFWLAPDFIDYVKLLIPFINKDNARAWARGLLLEGKTLTGTDNISLIQAFMGPEYEPPIACVIPEPTLRELVRIKEKPSYATVSVRSITFCYPDGKWLCSRLMPNDWPAVTKFFEAQGELKELTADFWESIDTLKDFTDDNDSIFFDTDAMRTAYANSKVGASVEGQFPATKGAIAGKFLLRLKGLATHMAFDDYPKPMLFVGDRIRGVLTGMTRND